MNGLFVLSDITIMHNNIVFCCVGSEEKLSLFGGINKE